MPNLAGPWTGRVSEASEAIINPRSFVRSLAALQAPFKTSLPTAPHLRLTVGTSVEERVCR